MFKYTYAKPNEMCIFECLSTEIATKILIMCLIEN